MPTDPRLDLKPRTTDDTDGDVQKMLGRLEDFGHVQKVVRLIANSPTVFKPFVLMSTALMAKATFPPAEREVVILYLAARRGVNYEWAEHVPISAAAGITDEQREALSNGTLDDLSSFSDSERLALSSARELVEDQSLTEGTWARAVEQWSEQGALDLIFTVAWWGGFVPTVIEAFGVESPDV